MEVHAIPALEDNYIWMIEEEDVAYIVDPGEAAPVIDYLESNKIEAKGILLTHDHWDHVDGVSDLLEKYPELSVVGPSETERFNSKTVKDGDIFKLFDERVIVYKTAGHTEDHISYVVNNVGLFCGDSLFYAGCGRVFTGDYQAEFSALKAFCALSSDTKVYAAHEYSLTNLEFAQAQDPESKAISKALEEVRQLRSEDKITLPTTIGHEKEVNLFVQAESVSDFKALRDQRDAW